MPKVFNHADFAYHHLYNQVCAFGVTKEDRTETGTLSLFGAEYMINVRKDCFPIITSKRVHWKSVFAELLWFISGQDHIRDLQEYTHIWDDWADEDGNLDTAYGDYWRNFPGKHGERYDQLFWAVTNLDRKPESRRSHVTAWYPPNAMFSRLPPCHHSFTLNVTPQSDGPDEVNIHVQQRSGDLALGIPFNMSSYSLLLILIANELGLAPGFLYHTITDLHIYDNHREKMKAQMVERDATFAEASVEVPVNTALFDLSLKHLEGFDVVGYEHAGSLSFPVAV